MRIMNLGRSIFRSYILLACWASICSAFSNEPVAKCSRGRYLPSPLYMMKNGVDRRGFFGSVGTVVALPFLFAPSSQAMGLMQFPCREALANTYHFMRAGENLMEADDIWSTNPLFLTNREAALSPEGIKQVEEACRMLREQDVNPSIVRYSLAASTMDTTNILGTELKVGRDRLVPEFNYMDPRAVGKWDMLPLSSTESAVWALDADEAGSEGNGGRPPPNEDSTPHETLADQSIRLRQLLSVLETQYSGDTVVLVFPDGTGPALLSAMIAGVPFNRVHELEYQPGEIRLNVTMDSTLALLKGTDREEYNAVIANGRKELKRLREMKPDEVISVKDQQLERDRLEMDEYLRKQEEKRLAREASDRSAREARVRQIEETRQRGETESGAPVLLGATGATVVGATIAIVGGNYGKQETPELTDNASPATNATETTNLDVAIMDRPSIDIPAIRSLDIGATSSTSDEEESRAFTRINGDRQARFPSPPKPRDPVKAAEEAMQDYMDSDDGGSDWLEVMADLMLEDDEEESEDSNSSNNS